MLQNSPQSSSLVLRPCILQKMGRKCKGNEKRNRWAGTKLKTQKSLKLTRKSTDFNVGIVEVAGETHSPFFECREIRRMQTQNSDDAKPTWNPDGGGNFWTVTVSRPSSQTAEMASVLAFSGSTQRGFVALGFREKRGKTHLGLGNAVNHGECIGE